jgi:hypothetical protein
MDKAVTIYGAINCGEGTPEQWATLETELAIEIEYTSWPLVSDELIRNLVEVRRWLIHTTTTRIHIHTYVGMHAGMWCLRLASAPRLAPVRWCHVLTHP